MAVLKYRFWYCIKNSSNYKWRGCSFLPTLLAALGIGFISSGLTYVCFVQALRQLGAAQTEAYFARSPFIGAAISVLLLGEQITQVLVISAILMAVGVGICLQESQ